MRSPPTAREPVAAAIALIAAATADLRLRSGDEGGQAIDAASVRNHGLRLRLVLRLRTVFARFAMLTRLMLIALIRLALARLLVVVAHIGLRLLRHEAGLLAKTREILAVVLAFFAHHFVGARLLLLLRLVLPELLLGGCDQAEVVLGVLVVFLGDLRGGTADLDVGSVGLEYPGHRILAAPIVVIVVVTVAHPLVVLTVSHVLPLFQP